MIGDVGGRGMEAAATMGQIRNALRAYALKGAGPAEVIDDLHALVDQSGGEITFATVVYVVLDLATGRGELATAGHLPPLIAGAGYVDAPRCPPLGLQRRRPTATSGASRSRAGRRCGCTPTGWSSPARGRSTPGLAMLADAAGRADGPLGAIADHLLVTLPAARDDDIALLGLRRVG